MRAVRDVSFDAAGRRDHRPAGSERRGQDDDAAHDRDAGRARRRSRARRTASTSSRDRYAGARRASACCRTRAASTRASPPARTSATRRAARPVRRAALESAIDALIALLGLRTLADRRTRGLLAGRAHEGRHRARARARSRNDPARRAHQRPGRHERARACATLLRALRGAGKCVLFSTHVMQEVAALCDRIVDRRRTAACVAHGHGRPSSSRAAGTAGLEDAFVALLGTGEGLAA